MLCWHRHGNVHHCALCWLYLHCGHYLCKAGQFHVPVNSQGFVICSQMYRSPCLFIGPVRNLYRCFWLLLFNNQVAIIPWSLKLPCQPPHFPTSTIHMAAKLYANDLCSDLRPSTAPHSEMVWPLFKTSFSMSGSSPKTVLHSEGGVGLQCCWEGR